MANDLLVELQAVVQLVSMLGPEGELGDVISAFVVPLNRVREAPPAPGLEALNFAAPRGYIAPHSLRGSRYRLLFEIRSENEHQLVVVQRAPPCSVGARGPIPASRRSGIGGRGDPW